MKFEKELSRRATPEWEAYYFDYKGAKKQIKSITKALREVPTRGTSGPSSSSISGLRIPRPTIRSRRSQTSDSLLHGPEDEPVRIPDTASDEWKIYRAREEEFKDMLGRELAKINHFYEQKELAAREDIDALRAQLEVYEAQLPQQMHAYSVALRRFVQPAGAQRDYTRQRPKDVPAHYAKAQLKAALAETHRGLFMIRSFTLDNEEAFRKILKKFKKNRAAVRVQGVTEFNFLEERVRPSRFVSSPEVKHLMDETEDLYAKHFEGGNRKIAAEKLRNKSGEKKIYPGAASRASALFSAGTVLAILGLVFGAIGLYRRPDLHAESEYVLQLYAGQFLIILLALLFALGTIMFQKFKVNYAFIFELDKRTTLHWQQLLEITSWFMFVLGFCMYMNLDHVVGGPAMFRWWPLVSVVLTVVLYFAPAPLPYFRARMWLAKTVSRLLFSGLVRVGFGEFFLGDLLCSLTYVTGNIELFFCLYARSWTDLAQCNSSHSRLLGFLTALPAVFRALQCLRRAGIPGTKNFAPKPHLFNFVKYCLTIGQYVCLSLYRLEKTTPRLIAFCVISGLTTIYSTLWDIVYDWSLATDFRPGIWPLREVLVYKKRWIYMTAMPIDAVLRCNWIPYAIWTKDAQHSSVVSFAVALAEVLRRSMWLLFRIENEQATNTSKEMAFQIRRLPYNLDLPSSSTSTTEVDQTAPSNVDGVPDESTFESQASRPVSTLQRFGSELRAAHTNDYERRKPTGWEHDDSDDDE